MNSLASSVTDLNCYIKSIIDQNEVLQNVYVVGEISNFKHHSSGHIYFSLKDEKSSIKCMIFSNCAEKIKFNLENGIKIFAYGYVSCYINAGQYQIYVYYVTPAGAGEINESLKKLYKKFESKGFFDESKKKTLKKFPRKIGVITSKTGAVIHDISSVLKRRWPIAEIVLASVKVQGFDAPEQIVNSIKLLHKLEDIDAIIIARGGGSSEDLWVFNDEQVIEEIYRCKIPVVSAVGHDVDYTLCDYVADVRASTPSVAAELVSEGVTNIISKMDDLLYKCRMIVNQKIESSQFMVSASKKELDKNILLSKIIDKMDRVFLLKNRAESILLKFLDEKVSKLSLMINKIKFFQVDNLLRKGYSLVISHNKVINSVDFVDENSRLKLVLSDGYVEFDIKNVSKEKK